MAGIVTIAIILSLFTAFLIFFGFGRVDQKIGIWIIVIALLAMVIGWSAEGGVNISKPTTHPTHTLAEYVWDKNFY